MGDSDELQSNQRFSLAWYADKIRNNLLLPFSRALGDLFTWPGEGYQGTQPLSSPRPF